MPLSVSRTPFDDFCRRRLQLRFRAAFAKEIEKNGMDGARRFSEEVFGVLFTVLLFLTIVMELSMPFIVRTVIAPGFTDDPVKFENTVRLAVIMFPYLACMSLAAMMGGMLNSLHRYFAAAIAPVFLNIILIGVLAVAWWRGYDALAVGYGLSWGVMAAGLVQLAIVWIAVRNAGIKIGFRRPRLTPNVRRLLVLALPAAITGASHKSTCSSTPISRRAWKARFPRSFMRTASISFHSVSSASRSRPCFCLNCHAHCVAVT